LLPEKLQKQNGLRLLSISVDLPPDAPPSELSRGDLQLFSIGHDAPIEFFAREPATVGIVVDTSGSMDAKLAQAGAAITQFVTQIEPRDDIFLYAFNSKPYLLQPLTFDHQLVLQRVSLLHAEGESSIYDALIHGIETLQRGCHRKKALFLITDGMDNSSFHSKQEVMAAAHKLNSPIFSIGIGNANYQGPLSLAVMGLGRQDDYVDTRTLSELAQQTGGQIYLLRTVGNGDQLKKDAAAIAGAHRQSLHSRICRQ
jgi:VWFA-related protein